TRIVLSGNSLPGSFRLAPIPAGDLKPGKSALPEGLPYRAQPVHDCNEASGYDAARLDGAKAAGDSGGTKNLPISGRPHRGKLSTAAQMFPKSWPSFGFKF